MNSVQKKHATQIVPNQIPWGHRPLLCPLLDLVPQGHLLHHHAAAQVVQSGYQERDACPISSGLN